MKLTQVCKVSQNQALQGDIACLLWHKQELFSTAHDGTVKIWRRDLKFLSEFKAHDYAISDMISGQDDNIFTCSNDFQIKEWKKDGEGQWRLERTMSEHKDAVRKMCLYKGLLYSGDDAGEIRVWHNGHVEGVINVVEEVWDMFMAEDKLYTVRDRDVVVSSMNPGHVSVTLVNTLFGMGPIRVLGDNLIFLDRGGMEIQVHDSKTKGNPLKTTLQGHTMMINAIASDSGRAMVFSGGWDEQVVAWDLKSMSKAAHVSTGGYINVMTVDGDECSKSQYLFVGGGNGNITAYEIQD